MSDNYQAIYDAVRSRIGGCDIGSAVQSALLEANIGHHAEMIGHAARVAAASIEEAHTAPSAVYRPQIFVDGDMWCALYGDDLQSGVCGFGKSPALAMAEFNKNWNAPLAARNRTKEPS